MKLLNGVSTGVLSLCALAASGTFNDAGAVPFTVTDSVGGTATEQAVSFNGFDPAGGILVGVRFDLSATKSATATVGGSFTGGEGGIISGGLSTRVSGTFSVTLPSAPALFSDSVATTTVTCTTSAPSCGPSATSFGPVPASGGSVTLTDPVVLAALTGASSTFAVTLSVASVLDFCTVQISLDERGSCFGSGSSTWTGEITVTFLTGPTPSVPLPATMALLATAALGLGALRRRSR